MGLVDSKKNVFTTIGAYNSFLENSKNQKDYGINSFSSINNKKEIVPYLIDVLKVVVGTDALKQLIGNFFTKFIDGAISEMRISLKKQMIQHNSNEHLPNYFKTTGINVPVKNIDVFGKLKINPNSNIGNLVYGNTDSFDKKAYEAISLDGTPVEYNNLKITYNSITDEFNFKPTTASSNKTIGEWFGDYIDNAVIIDSKEFSTNVMNAVYGTVTSNQKKTVEQIYNELQIYKLIDQLLQDNDSFEISQNDYDEMLKQAEAFSNGVVKYDMGCGIITAELSLNDMTNVIQQISGTTDPFVAGNAIENTIQQSCNDVKDVYEKNKETIKDGFFLRIIKMIQLMLAQLIVLSPQTRMLQAIMSAFDSEDGIPKISTPKEDLKKFKIFIKCLLKDLAKMINKFIFELILSFLIAMLEPITKKIIEEKINQYVGILKSLTI